MRLMVFRLLTSSYLSLPKEDDISVTCGAMCGKMGVVAYGKEMRLDISSFENLRLSELLECRVICVENGCVCGIWEIWRDET